MISSTTALWGCHAADEKNFMAWGFFLWDGGSLVGRLLLVLFGAGAAVSHLIHAPRCFGSIGIDLFGARQVAPSEAEARRGVCWVLSLRILRVLGLNELLLRRRSLPTRRGSTIDQPT